MGSQGLESRLIGTIAQCKLCRPSKNWLGLYLKTKREVEKMANSNLAEIFNLIAEHVMGRIGSLSAISNNEQLRKKGLGLAGWLKVEILKALEKKNKIEDVINVKEKGPDLILEGGLNIKLKAVPYFNCRYIISGLAYKNCPCCIFLGYNRDAAIGDIKKQLEDYKKEVDLKKETLIPKGKHLYISIEPDGKGVIEIEKIKQEELRSKNGWFLGLIKRKEIKRLQKRGVIKRK
jgi:hypothetical protein